MKLAPWFERFPNEAKLVGSILTGYGELEFWLATCVGTAMRDNNTAFRLIFRLRNESQRIDAADALLYPAMKKLKLAGPYSHVIGAMRHCRTIRNQYSHCHWFQEAGKPFKLKFYNLESTAFTSEGDGPLNLVETSAALLAEQVAYFEYCLEGWRYLIVEQDVRAGRLSVNTFDKPKARQQPKLDSR